MEAKIRVQVYNFADNRKAKARVYKYTLDKDGHLDKIWVLSSSGEWVEKKDALKLSESFQFGVDIH